MNFLQNKGIDRGGEKMKARGLGNGWIDSTYNIYL